MVKRDDVSMEPSAPSYYLQPLQHDANSLCARFETKKTG
ncbi:hypothetical protein SAMN05216535_3266 [Stutzerimonas xanthomarina]|uniref:Uncharacterized protein n=2 Tax=Stutzerimonas xanthomarina TaxID=271420 RepID=A0A1M5SEL1_9GAMM|nr:hypothetical protein SAMN05216535_3266 [Stutzerimonas xanthomarina]SHH36353.1 hypothetical protein SAMN02744645_3414 [Stutzerimonas xanthomarina DSM 18231]